MAKRISNTFPLTVPTQSNAQCTATRQQKEWQCPICGVNFDQEKTKDLHMAICKRQSQNDQQYSNYVVVDSPKMTSQPVTLCLKVQYCSEKVSYISDMECSHTLGWNSSKSLYTGRVSLKPGQNKGRVRFATGDKPVPVQPFDVSQYPTNNSNIEIFLQQNVLIPKPDTTRSSPILKGDSKTATSLPQPLEKNYGDDEIYINVSDLANNIRLNYEVKQLKDRVRELENDNTRLKEKHTLSEKIIDQFHRKQKELESELSRITNAREFENNQKFLPKPTKAVASPRHDKQET